MKKTTVITLLFILTCILCCFAGKAQNAKLDPVTGNYSAISHNANWEPGKETGKLFTDNSGKQYPVFVSSKGKLYYNRISKAGNEYRAYLKIEN